VLLEEAVNGLAIQADDIVLDCTVGGGGHSRELCRRLGEKGRLLGIDRDAGALLRAEEAIRKTGCRYSLVHEDFRNLDLVLDRFKVREVTKILFDLGMSSDQLERSGRGFSLRKNEPLLMTLSDTVSPNDLTAREIVNKWDRERLCRILREYGEERFARRIASAIVERRSRERIDTTEQLVSIIREATPRWYQKRRIHYATKTFQALRMAVNDEIGALREGLAKGFGRLARGGRIAVISFHSIEDRVVKLFFRDKSQKKTAAIVTKKPIVPRESEVQRNPRSRSAKLRILEKT
jgi:16S rRNA (cytosine1402-N4)-methyltransferase